jgi:hypothetical protein
VDLRDDEKTARRTGTASLVGADVARCIAVWATVSDTVSDDELMARMALVTEGILPKVRLRTVEQRIDHEKVEP